MVQHMLEISEQDSQETLMTLFGDLRTTSYPKKLLTGLDGWNTPPVFSRITAPDPNGGNYADEHATPLGKILTLNWSIFHQNDAASYKALQELKKLSNKFYALKLTTILEDGAKVVETLENCYIFKEPTVVKAINEYKVSISMESKDFDFSSISLQVQDVAGNWIDLLEEEDGGETVPETPETGGETVPETPETP